MSFATELRAHLPEGLHLPDAFAVTFDWLEAQGWGGTFTHGTREGFRRRYLSIYPPEARDDPAASYVIFNFEPGPPLHEPPPEAMARIATLGTIAGDGGTLSIWRDDAGKQWVVVFNHGEPHVLTDDPVVALQFLALGYPEPGALLDPTRSVVDYARAEGYDPPRPPEAFRGFLGAQFNVTLPDRASDLGITIPASGAPDPLRDWLDTVMPEPEVGAIPGMSAENPYVITPDLRELLGEDGIAALREALPFIVEQE